LTPSVYAFDASIGSLIAHLLDPYLTYLCTPFPHPLTTRDLSTPSSVRRFEASSCKPTSRDLPSSLLQHRGATVDAYLLECIPSCYRACAVLTHHTPLQVAFNSARGPSLLWDCGRDDIISAPNIGFEVITYIDYSVFILPLTFLLFCRTIKPRDRVPLLRRTYSSFSG